MAESAARAFGRFMLALREHAGLSQPDVCRLFEDSPETIDKGSLSRFERGQQGLSLGKIVTLSRIYRVSPEVVVERLELDRELERQNGPDTEGRSFRELAEAGRRALEGLDSRWRAYGFFRDALARAGEGAEILGVRLNLATTVRGLGKNRLALHELLALESATRDTALHVVVLDRIANCRRCLDDLAGAERDARAAADEAELRRDGRALAYALNSLANVALARGDDPAETADLLSKALRAGRSAGNGEGALRPSVGFEITTLNMLAECHLRAGRHPAARRAALEARTLSLRQRIPSGRAWAALLLGQVAEHAGEHDRAESLWREAISVARSIENKRLEFAAEFCRHRRALRAGEPRTAEAARRRLERLAPWVPEHLPWLAEFRESRPVRTGTSRPRTVPAVRSQARPRGGRLSVID